jgi:adenine-specific DNA-methyltransferase
MRSRNTDAAPAANPADDVTPAQLTLSSLDVGAGREAALRELFPDAFTDNRFDPAKIEPHLSVARDERPTPERYGLSWAGKADAMRAVQVLSTGTLHPNRDESVEFDSTPDVMIEGDNLEALKLLQRSYYGKVKMIYIDPPYNTGQEFIYPDNYREGLDTYLRFTGQTDEEGRRITANAESGGRYHSKWLSMMYPRLVLARNLLRRDGVLFATIDDHEVHNFRLLLDEVFGPENFVASVIWQKVYSPKNTARHFSEDHDYVLCYARDAAEWVPNLLPRTEEMEARYKNPDNDSRGPWKPADLSARNYYSKGTYPVQCPGGRKLAGPPSGRYWVVSEESFWEKDRDGRVWWGADGNAIPQEKVFLSEVKAGKVPQTLWKYDDVGHTQEAKKELLERVTFESSDSVFDTPKPTRLIMRMLRLATKPRGGDIVLDFFAGSGATGEAVWKLNLEDGGDRRFILVQLPEPTGYDDYATVADITKTRLRNASGALGEAAVIVPTPLGFRTFGLGTSNFKLWDSPSAQTDEDGLAQQLTAFAVSILQGAGDEDLLFEIILKSGVALSTQVEPLRDGKTFAIDEGGLVISLAEAVTEDVVDAIADRKPDRVVFLDRGFSSDADRANTTIRLRKAGVEVRVV